MQIQEMCNITRKPNLIAIDHGYFGTKFKTKDKNLYIRSKYERSNDILNKKDTYHLIYDNVDYIIGEGASISSIDYDKTSDEIYKILTLGILSMTTEMESDFYLMCSYPLSIFNNNKDAFANYIKGAGSFNTTFSVDGINKNKKKFNIIDVTTFPQGVAHAYSHPKHFLSKTCAILDFGGLTINGVILSDYNIIPKTSFTENLGSIILENKIRENLDTRFGTNIQDYELPDIIKYGLKYKGKILDGSQDIVHNTIKQHMNDIKKAMKLNNWNVESLDLVITGGSSVDYKDFLSQNFPQAIFSNNPINDGVDGLFYIGKLLYNL